MIYQILLLALFVEFLLGLHNPKRSLGIAVAIILLIPSGIKFSLGVNLNSFNLAIVVMIILLLPIYINKKPVFPIIRKTFVWYTLYIFLTSFIVALGTIPMSEYFQNMILFLMEYSLIAYFLCWVKFNKVEICQFNAFLTIAGGIVIVYSVFCYLTKTNLYMMYVNTVSGSLTDMSEAFMQEQRGILDGRTSGTFNHPLQLGQCVLLLFSYLIFEISDNKHRVIYSFYLFGLFLTAVLTGSRAALIPIILAPVIYFLSKKKSSLIRYSIIGLCSLPVGYSFLPKQGQDYIKGSVMFWDDRAASKADIRGSSFESRQNQLSAAFSNIDDSILLGRGFNYHTKHAEEYASDVLGYESVFLSHLIDGGVIGLIAFLFFYFQLYSNLLKKCVKTSGRLRTHTLCLPFFVGICLTGISYSMFCLFLILYMITLNRVQIQ